MNHLYLDPYSSIFRKYAAGPCEAAYFKGVPIHMLDGFRKVYRDLGIHFRIKYRGPRRPTRNGRSTCLKQDATSFAVYAMERKYPRRMDRSI